MDAYSGIDHEVYVIKTQYTNQGIRTMLILQTTLVLLYRIAIILANDSTYFENGNCEYNQKNLRFGGANQQIIADAFAHPAIFQCRWTDGGKKWLKFQVHKGAGLMMPNDASDDTISFYLGSGENQCSADAKFTEDAFKTDQKKGELTKEQNAFKSPNIAVSNPAETIGCLIAWCHRTTLSCVADFKVEFYEQYANAITVHHVAFGLGWADPLLVVVSIVEYTALVTVIIAFYMKYKRVANKLKQFKNGKAGKQRKSKRQSKAKKDKPKKEKRHSRKDQNDKEDKTKTKEKRKKRRQQSKNLKKKNSKKALNEDAG